MVESEWLRTGTMRPEMAIDAFVVMPNHLHAIIELLESTRPRLLPRPSNDGTPSRTLGAVIGGFKGTSTRIYNELRDTKGHKLWQRGYHERVIRNDAELARARQYIRNNPAKWAVDPDNPINDPPSRRGELHSPHRPEFARRPPINELG